MEARKQYSMQVLRMLALTYQYNVCSLRYAEEHFMVESV